MNPPGRDLLHCNPGNWKLGIFYFCPLDRRVVVPKRNRALGWTLNFARPMALPVLGFMLAVIYAVADLTTSFGPGGDPQSAIILLLALGLAAVGYRVVKFRLRNTPTAPDPGFHET